MRLLGHLFCERGVLDERHNIVLIGPRPAFHVPIYIAFEMQQTGAEVGELNFDAFGLFLTLAGGEPGATYNLELDVELPLPASMPNATAALPIWRHEFTWPGLSPSWMEVINYGPVQFHVLGPEVPEDRREIVFKLRVNGELLADLRMAVLYE